MPHSRPMTAEERYYAFLDRVFPMNLMLVAELDRCFAVDEVEQRWRAFAATRSVPRLQVTPELGVGLSGGAVGFEGKQLAPGSWNHELSRISLHAFGVERPMHCTYLTSEEGRSRIVLTAHHAVVDGRIGIAELQLFVRALAGQAVPRQDGLSAVMPPRDRFPWQHDRTEFIAQLRAMAARAAEVGSPEPSGWVGSDLGRAPRFQSHALDVDQSKALFGRGKTHAVRAFPAIAAGWLSAVAARICHSWPGVLQLATPVDLTTPSDDPSRPRSPAVAVIANRYAVDPDKPWALAQQVATETERSLRDGEGELFFHLTRARNIEDAEAGAQVVARAISAAPPVVSVTNLGPIDATGDPEWLHSVCGYLAPTPNQVVFVSGTGYRGQLVQSIATNDAQLQPDLAVGVVDQFVSTVRSMIQS